MTLRLLVHIWRIQRKARRAGCRTREESLAWAIEHGYIVNESSGKARLFFTSFEERDPEAAPIEDEEEA